MSVVDVLPWRGAQRPHTNTFIRIYINTSQLSVSNCCFLPWLLLLLLIVANKQLSAALNPVFCWSPSKLSLSIPQSRGGKANMFSLYKSSCRKSKVIFSIRKIWGCSERKSSRHRHLCLCVFVCVFCPCTHPYMYQAFSHESGTTIGLIISCCCGVIVRKWTWKTVKEQVKYNSQTLFLFNTLSPNVNVSLSFLSSVSSHLPLTLPPAFPPSPFLSLSALICSTSLFFSPSVSEQE